LFNTKVIGLLRRFSGSEHKLFLKFLQSPYFNTNANVVELYRYLHKYAPDYTHVNVHRERVFAHLFGNEAFKDIKIRQFATLLADLIEQFWATEQWRKQPLQVQLHLASAFLQHGLDTHLNDTLAHIEQSDNMAMGNSAAYYHRQLQVNELLHQSIENQQQRDQEPNLQKVSDYLDAYYLVNKLKYACKALSFQRFKNEPYNLQLLAEVSAHLQQNDYSQHPAIQIYYHALRTFDADLALSEQHFEELKAQLFAHQQAFNITEKQEMFTMVHNYCTRQLNLNNRRYLAVLFEVYVFEIEHHIISPDGNVPAGLYRNIVTVAQYQQQYEWLERFIAQFRHSVDEDTYLLNLARVWFEQGKFEQVVGLLKDKSYDEALTMPAFKSLQLRTYYELYQTDEGDNDLDYGEYLDNGLVNFIALLKRRRKEWTTHYAYYFNFAKYLQQLSKWTYQPKIYTKQLAQLAQTVEQTTEVAEKSWLLAKIMGLK
jgi:hypothetical protein